MKRFKDYPENEISMIEASEATRKRLKQLYPDYQEVDVSLKKMPGAVNKSRLSHLLEKDD